MTADAPAIVLDGVGKRFADSWVLRDVCLEVGRGSIVGLIGPSGCGKTTTIRVITGSYRPEAGLALTLGARSDRLTDRQRQRLGYLPQHPVVFESLSIAQNIVFHASMNGLGGRARRKRVDALLELVDLVDDVDKPAADASGGMQRRMALAAAMAHEPELIILDEPTAGIDPILRVRFWEYFRELAAGGTTLLITTQYVGEAAYCDLVGLLAEGRLLNCAAPDALRRAAYGGEVIRIEASRPLSDAEARQLSTGVDGVVSIERQPPATLRIVVDDAGAKMAGLLGALTELGIDILESEEVVADYDDVFVRLVEDATETSGRIGGAAHAS